MKALLLGALTFKENKLEIKKEVEVVYNVELNQKELDDIYSILCHVARSKTAYSFICKAEEFATDPEDMGRFKIQESDTGYYTDEPFNYEIVPTYGKEGENV